jgi:hypothetical protein
MESDDDELLKARTLAGGDIWGQRISLKGN